MSSRRTDRNSRMVEQTWPNCHVSKWLNCITKTWWKSWLPITKRFNLALTKGKSQAMNIPSLRSKHSNLLLRFHQMAKRFRFILRKYHLKVNTSRETTTRSISPMVTLETTEMLEVGKYKKSKKRKLKRLRRPCNFNCVFRKRKWENSCFSSSWLLGRVSSRMYRILRIPTKSNQVQISLQTSSPTLKNKMETTCR